MLSNVASNVVDFPVGPIRKKLANAELNEARIILERMEVTAQVCQHILDKAGTYGEEATRRAIDQVINAYFYAIHEM